MTFVTNRDAIVGPVPHTEHDLSRVNAAKRTDSDNLGMEEGSSQFSETPPRE
jgi:hypothetical protein